VEGQVEAIARQPEAEAVVGNDIEPWQRRALATVQDDGILAPAVGESAQAIRKLQRRREKNGRSARRHAYPRAHLRHQ
jgi:hypothetical protein